ncbi:MAG: alpha/beta hydrolase [Lachnospiraceae bacterium]|nr:alpha/beta hydrolase [Lachnospiraceae bacterium]
MQKKLMSIILIVVISMLSGCGQTNSNMSSKVENSTSQVVLSDVNVNDIEEMDLTEQIHPELRKNLPEFGTGSLVTKEMIPDIRESLKGMESENVATNDNVTVTQKTVPGLPGNPDVTIYIFKPVHAGSNMPGMLYIHGGGMIFGSVNEITNDLINEADSLNCTIISPEYRLAPENPYPAGLNDCYAALSWFAGNAKELNVNPDNIVVSGMSAGGGIAAAIAIKARDENGPKIAAQFLDSPMLDYRNNTSSAMEITDKRFWCRQENILAWEMYLGTQHPEKVSPQASPAVLNNFEGLPPTFISVGEVDVFRDESIAYAQKLQQAGIFTDLHVYAGVYHGASGDYPYAEICKKMVQDRINAISNFYKHGYF